MTTNTNNIDLQEHDAATNAKKVKVVSGVDISSVAIKDATTDTRAVVGADGLQVEVKKLPAVTGTVDVDNLPTVYPLPSEQVTTLTPPAAITGYATSAKQDTTNDTIVLLRRIVKLLESNAVVDANMRQKINIEAGTLPTVSTVSTVSTVTTVSTVSTVSNATALGGVDARWLIMETARNSYANSIRSKLSFT